MTSLSYLKSLDNEWIEMTLGLVIEDQFVRVVWVGLNRRDANHPPLNVSAGRVSSLDWHGWGSMIGNGILWLAGDWISDHSRHYEG